jgi:hypothetical protein
MAFVEMTIDTKFNPVDADVIKETLRLNSAPMMWSEFLPDGVDNSQLVKIFKKYLDENPSQLHRPFTNLFIIAINEAFQN